MSSAASTAGTNNVASTTQNPSSSQAGMDNKTPEAIMKSHNNNQDGDFQITSLESSETPIGRTEAKDNNRNDSELPTLKRKSIYEDGGDVEILRTEIPDSETISEISSPGLRREQSTEMGDIAVSVSDVPNVLPESLQEPADSFVSETYALEVYDVESPLQEDDEPASVPLSSTKAGGTARAEAVAVESRREGVHHAKASPGNIEKIERSQSTPSEVDDILSTPMPTTGDNGNQVDESLPLSRDLAYGSWTTDDSLRAANIYFTHAPAASKENDLKVTFEASPIEFNELATTEANISNAVDVEVREEPPIQNSNSKPTGSPSSPIKMEDHQVTLATLISADDPHLNEVPSIQERLSNGMFSENDNTLPRSLPESTGTSVSSSIQRTENVTHSSHVIPSPTNPEASSSIKSNSAESLKKSFTAPEGSQNKDILMSELKAMKIASIQARIASIEAEIARKRADLEEVTKELENPAAETVRKHIKLLHDYNDIRDVGQGLIGMIADNRGVRIGELYGEFGVGLQD